MEKFVLPKDWYLEITKENIEKASEWRKAMCTIKNPHYLSDLNIGYSLVSKHSDDSSFYHYNNLSKSKNPNYRNYRELTTEQFIKHVYNPKFNIMEEYVIKNLSLEHGAEIIQHFKELGIDTKRKMGDSYVSEDHSIYYGVIKGKFDNYSLSEVQLANTPIRELPKKELNMYSIKELETNEYLVVYLDSQEEWNKLKELTIKLCVFSGKHCYSLHNRTWSNTSSKTDSGFYENATIITINQIKELNMRKEIIGYKLVKLEYEKSVAGIVHNDYSMSLFFKNDYIISTSSSIKKLKDAGVLDLWFEPVYNTETLFNIGDWVYVEKAYSGATGADKSVGQITAEESNSGLLKSEKGITVKIGSKIWKIGRINQIEIRLATKEEIAKAQSKVYVLGIDEKFEIVVRDKKAYYDSEDVTETLLDFKRNFKHLFLPYKGVKYTWNFEDLIILSVGCIKKESYLSQWLAIDLT